MYDGSISVYGVVKIFCLKNVELKLLLSLHMVHNRARLYVVNDTVVVVNVQKKLFYC